MIKTMKWFSISTLAILLLTPWHSLLAQATTGYTKLGSVAAGTLTYTDTTPVGGDVYMYQVTAYNAAGESTPVTAGPAVIPTTAVAHSVTFVWGASPTAGITGYNVYRFLVQIPAPPTSGAVTVNQ